MPILLRARDCRRRVLTWMMTCPPHLTRELAHALRMCNDHLVARMIQVRNVPARLHRELLRRAKARGQTLTDYIQELLERETSRPPREEVFARIARRRRVRLPVSAAELIRQERPG